MKKSNFLYLIGAVTVLLSCGGNNPPSPGPDTPSGPQEEILPAIEVSRIVRSSAGKVYLEVDGKPFPLFGAQIRVDVFKNVDKLTDAQIEPYFRKAKELNVNCVQVPITWKGMEPAQGEYDFSWMDMILSYANKYDLKVELLWFSTNMIGDSYTWFIPAYAMTDLGARLKRKGTYDYDYEHNLYGYCFNAVFDDTVLLKNETAAVTALFNHIRVWDEKNGGRHPVITCQLHNEIDGLVRWRITDASLAISHKDGSRLTEEEAWSMTLNAVDAVGKAIKKSSYRVATRVNYTSCRTPGVFPQCKKAAAKDALSREGVDFISVDPYMENVSDIADVVRAFSEPSGNYPLLAENRGVYTSTPVLILTTAALGGGYDIYDLATSKFIYEHNGPPWNEEGVYTWNLMDRGHTPLTRSILKGLTAAGEDVALTAKEDFMAFNVSKNIPETVTTRHINTTRASLTVNTSSGAIGFILDRGDSIVMYFTAPTTVVIENGTVDTGAKTFNLKAEELKRVGFKSAGKLTSTTASCIAGN